MAFLDVEMLKTLQVRSKTGWKLLSLRPQILVFTIVHRDRFNMKSSEVQKRQGENQRI